MTDLSRALGEAEWDRVFARRLDWSLNKDCSVVTVTDPNTGRSAKGRTLCLAVRALT